MGNKGRERLPYTAFKKPRAFPVLLGSTSQKITKKNLLYPPSPHPKS